MNDRDILDLGLKCSELSCFINEQKFLSALDLMKEIKEDIENELIIIALHEHNSEVKNELC